MLDFVRAMEIAKRACIYMGEMECNADCPCNMDGEEYKCSFCHARDVSDWQKVERRLIEWDKAHPEPQYPTLAEWQDENFPDAPYGINCCNFIPCPYPSDDCDSDCRNKPIPAEIAKKLGIKPKEAAK